MRSCTIQLPYYFFNLLSSLTVLQLYGPPWCILNKSMDSCLTQGLCICSLSLKHFSQIFYYFFILRAFSFSYFKYLQKYYLLSGPTPLTPSQLYFYSYDHSVMCKILHILHTLLVSLLLLEYKLHKGGGFFIYFGIPRS